MFRLVNALDCLVFALFLYLLIVFIRDRGRRGVFLHPPGPPSWPIIGNLLDVPKDAPWIAYSNMSKKYGRCNILSFSEHRLALAETYVLKAMLFVFAFLIRSSSYCARYQPLRIFLRSVGKYTQIGLTSESRKCTSCSVLSFHRAAILTIVDQ